MRVEVYDQSVLVEAYEVPDDVPVERILSLRAAIESAATLASLRAAMLRLVDVVSER